MTQPSPLSALLCTPIEATPDQHHTVGCHSHRTRDTVRCRTTDHPAQVHSSRQERPLQRSEVGAQPLLSSPVRPGVDMFDAFIINRIRRERQREQERRIPLHIEAPRRPEPRHERRHNSDHDTENKRGIEIIDYSI